MASNVIAKKYINATNVQGLDGLLDGSLLLNATFAVF
jgi:hypothetical protein